MDGFQQAYPQIEIQLTSTIWADKTASGEADVEFRLGSGKWPDHDAQFLFSDPLVAVCSPDTANSIGVPAAAAELAAHPLLHVMGAEDTWGRFFGLDGVDRGKNRSDIRVDSSLTASEQAAVSNRVALIHNRFAEHYVRLGRLVFASNVRLEPEEAIYMLRPQNAERRKPEAILFEKWVTDHHAT